MGGTLFRKAVEYSSKALKNGRDIDNPITLDGSNFLIEIGKGIIKIGKELL